MTSAPTIPDATSIPRPLSRARIVGNRHERLGRIERVIRLGEWGPTVSKISCGGHVVRLG